MMKPDTIIASLAFIMFVAATVAAFLQLAKPQPRITISFYVILLITGILWMLHGYLAQDIALAFGAGIGTFTCGSILGIKLWQARQVSLRTSKYRH